MFLRRILSQLTARIGPVAVFTLSVSGASCVGSKTEVTTMSNTSYPAYCGLDPLAPGTSGGSGQGLIFQVDPMVASGNPVLSPSSNSIGNFTSSVTLENLSGRGVLSGAYIDVVNGLCGDRYGARSATNDFRYSYDDSRFAEVMDYHSADRFRSELDAANALLPADPITLISNCDIEDNAFYTQDFDSNHQLYDLVCMGKSSRYAKASLSHDSQVTVHELQHATTGHAYSPTVDLNRFDYDEAGAMNEGISDFMALMMSAPETSGGFDLRVFSRWALGSFFTRSSARGANRCPAYDSSYPNCGAFASDATGFSADNNHVSYVYPDGLGWPYARTFSAPGYVRNTFLGTNGQQSIHQNAPIITGTLWEIYEALRTNHANDEEFARRTMMKLVTEAIALLPKPNSSVDLSPVTFPKFGQRLNTAASALSLSVSDRNAIQAVTDLRGLTNAPQLSANWARVGPGSSANAGLRFIDLAPANGNRNEKFNRGDQGAVWLDIENLSSLTAGGLLVDVSIIGSGIRFLGSNYNTGFLSDSRAMVRYGKVNGSAVVSALSSTNAAYHVPTGSTYLKTDPNYDVTGYTALWVEVRSNAAPGTVTFRARIQPENGPEVTLDFPAVIQ